MDYASAPKVRSHKIVGAAEITGWSFSGQEQITFYLAGGDHSIQHHAIIARYRPTVGDFLVFYGGADNYVSISPRAAFLEGYTPTQES